MNNIHNINDIDDIDNDIDNNITEGNNSDDILSTVSSYLPFNISVFKQFCYPILVFIITLLINNNEVKSGLLKIRFFQDDNSLNMFGYILQAFLIAALYFIILYFIKNIF
jgi:hypothetical protein